MIYLIEAFRAPYVVLPQPFFLSLKSFARASHKAPHELAVKAHAPPLAAVFLRRQRRRSVAARSRVPFLKPRRARAHHADLKVRRAGLVDAGLVLVASFVGVRHHPAGDDVAKLLQDERSDDQGAVFLESVFHYSCEPPECVANTHLRHCRNR